MRPYANLSGNSGVIAYESGADSITVAFADGMAYVYTHSSAGRDKVEQMKALAASGRGLSTFIVQQVRKAYAQKLDMRSSNGQEESPGRRHLPARR